ncbi:hypothetical protein A5634_09560 [Mycobacterium asiaticum]|uniref:PPE family domain-containing protein n=1 Tax=Mycobacterium asiaticum TaxID=1790 RepID=A0A1A3NMZ0_MYCAS|nr:PPE family protein [Mycobacterium asiaticum]OBK21702.1 hypothetical protein A5634_09560 [Mycobacterium asiaticum]
MDFGALPPEVNSASMYAGAGAGPMLAAAAAWNGIASEMSAAAGSFATIVTQLTTEQWISSASMSMAAAVQPLVAWLTDTAESSALAASQAMASAAAFDRAFAMTVPPPAVAANRALLAELVATNVLGRNVPAIAATEARYGEMWAQDAAAMYEYAAASATAGRLNPLTDPAPITTAAGTPNQAAAVAQAAGTGVKAQEGLTNLISHGPDAVHSLAAPAAPEGSTSLLDLLSEFDKAELWWADEFDHNRATYWDYSVGQIGTGADGEGEDALDEIGAAPQAATAARALTPVSVATTPITAGLGKATFAGGLSVPASWSNSLPAPAAASAIDGTYWVVPQPDEYVEAMPPAPGMFAISETGGLGASPRYGVKPAVMPKQGLF